MRSQGKSIRKVYHNLYLLIYSDFFIIIINVIVVNKIIFVIVMQKIIFSWIKIFGKPFEFISLGNASPTETNSEHAQHRRLYRAHVQS